MSATAITLGLVRNEIEAPLKARITELEAAITRAAKLIDANKYHQWEKIEDAGAILREALNS
jgi:hypothetical protein